MAKSNFAVVIPIRKKVKDRKPDSKRMKHSTINEILPPEIVEKIIKLLNVIDIFQAQLICRRWKEIIDNGNLLKKVSGETLSLFCYICDFILFQLFFLRKDFMHFCCWTM